MTRNRFLTAVLSLIFVGQAAVSAPLVETGIGEGVAVPVFITAPVNAVLGTDPVPDGLAPLGALHGSPLPLPATGVAPADD